MMGRPHIGQARLIDTPPWSTVRTVGCQSRTAGEARSTLDTDYSTRRQDRQHGLVWLLRIGGGLQGAGDTVGCSTREELDRPLICPQRMATRANATSTFDVDVTRQIVHVRPVETGPCHLVTDRSCRPPSDSHLPRIEADMCIAGEYRLALIPLWLNGFPGCDASCCPVRRSAGPRGGTTSAPSRVVRASTTPSTVTPPAAGMALASPSSASRQVRRFRSVSSRRSSVAPCPRRQVPRWGRRGVRTR